MKFLCGNCKAKYQIADEKVTGRTLRMKCRRCGHDILIDGHTMPQSTPPSPTPTPRRTGGSTVSVVPGPRQGSAAQPLPARGSPALPRPTGSTRSKPPSGLSAEFRRHVAAPPEVPQRSAPYDLWHVAIQDVPVGPMTRDELSRKIEAGAVTPESLCWREGMDDWRPVGELAELASLLRRTRDASRPLRGRPPPNVPGPGAATGSRSAPLPLPPTPAPAPEEFDEDNAEPTRISEFSPALALAAASGTMPQSFAAPNVSNTSPRVMVPQNLQMASASAPLPEVSTQVVPQPTGRRNWNDSAGLIAIGILVGILVVAGPMLYRTFWGASENTPVSAASGPTTKSGEPEKQAPVQVELPEEPVVEAKPEDTVTARAPARTQKPAAPKPEPAKPATNGKTLSAEQRALLERMGGGANDPDLSRLPRANEEGGGGPVAAALTPQQLTKVVQDNKNQLQRCYETALRAAGGRQDGAIKISVSVTVGGSGTTKSVSTTGDGLGSMTDCIRSAVKRWRFPQAASESEFAFPLVFQPGA